MDKIFEITAKEVTVQVKDERTGVVYSRTLPIDYYENANVLKLSGENLDGSSSSIVFYSARGMERLKDLTGKGADHDAIHIAAEHSSRRLNRLAALQLNIPAGQEQGMPIQLEQPSLKGDAGSGRGFFKNHPQRFPFQPFVGDVVLFSYFS